MTGDTRQLVCLREPDPQHSSVSGGPVLEASEVDSPGEDEDSEPPVEELQRCVSRCRLRRFDHTRHISGVLPPTAPRPHLHPARQPLRLPHRTPPKRTVRLTQALYEECLARACCRLPGLDMAEGGGGLLRPLRLHTGGCRWTTGSPTDSPTGSPTGSPTSSSLWSYYGDELQKWADSLNSPWA